MIDFNLNVGKSFKNDDIDLVLQQIDILFDTTPRDVLGSTSYGTKYDSYLYDTLVSAEAISDAILKDIQSLELFGFRPKVETAILQGTEQDIAVIQITLTNRDAQYEKIYKIS